MLHLSSNFGKFFPYCVRMTTRNIIERVKENADLAARTITELKNELNNLSNDYNNIRAQQLREENARLMLAVEEAKGKLIQVEISNNVKQIPLPQQATNVKCDAKIIAPSPVNIYDQTNLTETTENPINVNNSKALKPVKNEETKKEKKPKEKAAPVQETPIDVGRLDLRVAKVEDVQRHPDADTLYVLKIYCGEEKLRTVCSGLVKHVPIEELKDRLVMLLCNLKPVKMRGITSEAMVMCASSAEGVEVLIPPANAVPGDLIDCDGYKRQPDAVMNPKKKIFETVAPDLHTNSCLEACYKNIPFTVQGKGTFTAKTLKNVSVK